MSLFPLLSTAVAVPFVVVLAIFMWFMIRAQIAWLFKKIKPTRKKSTRAGSLDLTKTNPVERPVLSTATLPQLKLSSNLAAGISTRVPVHEAAESTFASEYAAVYATASSVALSYQPLSTYLGNGTLNGESLNNEFSRDLSTLIPGTPTLEFEISDIPGINIAMEKELLELGYTSIEQIARWGRADVRAVSANLGIDQQKIEDEWIAGARLILSIK